jgi:D-glycero-D-manno-heptose 1,7-bisphosphate phosphatase
MGPRRTLRKAAFIDRDGVLNDLVDRGDNFRIGGRPLRWTAPWKLSELRIRPEVHGAIELIRNKGYLRILVTNQPDIANGHMDPDELKRIMAVFRAMGFDSIQVCLHGPNEGCACRKPAPGMLFAGRDALSVDMSRSYMIGDLETDVQAGKAAGVHTIRLSTELLLTTDADHTVPDIMAAARLLP